MDQTKPSGEGKKAVAEQMYGEKKLTVDSVAGPFGWLWPITCISVNYLAECSSLRYGSIFTDFLRFVFILFALFALIETAWLRHENRMMKDDWTEKCLFSASNSKQMCLLCSESTRKQTNTTLAIYKTIHKLITNG